MTDQKITALVELGNAAYKAAKIATPAEIAATMQNFLDELDRNPLLGGKAADSLSREIRRVA